MTAAPAVHPHTRGEYPQGANRFGAGVRFTPTRVGNTRVNNAEEAGIIGSPPHAWGIRALPQRLPARRRFTPTRVGNTRPTDATCRRMSVHPHTRGEYGHLALEPLAHRRFTPTRVGNTSTSAS